MGSYLSSSNPRLQQDYSSDSYSNHGANIYSNINKTTSQSPYGYGNGRITIWTNCGTDGDIRVYLHGEFLGKLTQYFSEGTPDCGESGTLSINKPEGTYVLQAKGKEYSWSATLTITENKCLIQGLQK